jgi:phosphate:Na+ symporter
MFKLSIVLVCLLFSFKIYSNTFDTIYVETTKPFVCWNIDENDSVIDVFVFSSVLETKFDIKKEKFVSQIYYYHQGNKGHHYVSIKKRTNQDFFVENYIIIVRSKTWWIWLLFGILGGLGLFLFGINFMSDGFVRFNEHKISQSVQRLSSNTGKSVIAGVFLTTILQSSSAGSIFMMRLVESRLMNFRQTIGIIIGGALGTTVTLQIIALKLNTYALFLIAIGFIFSFLTQNIRFRQIGQILSGLGFLYLGLLIMSENALELKNIESVTSILLKISNPFTGIFAGILFTAITQSASAFIGILMMLGSAGIISLDTAIPLFIGSNIGTSVPVLLASKNKSKEAQNVAMFHLLYRLLVASIFVFWIHEYSKIVIYVSEYLNKGNEVSLPHLIANAHTIMYLIVTVLFLPFIPLLYKYFSKYIRPSVKDDPFKPKYITEQSLESPGIALVLAKKEILHLANIVKKMVEDLLPAFLNKEKKIIYELEIDEKKVNAIRDEITYFLIKLNKNNIQIEMAREIYKLLGILKELEEIADIVDTNLLPKAKYWSNTSYDFSEDGKKELILFHEHCTKHLNSVVQAMVSFDTKSAKRLKKNEKETIRIAYELSKSHFSRLIEEVEATVQSSKTHIELIGLMQAITRHATQIIRILYDFA